MAQCEICGTEGKLVNAIVEGSMLSVCKTCAMHGSVVVVDKIEPEFQPRKTALVKNEEEVFVSDCALEVKKAREKKGLTQEQLAKAIAEKEATIHRVESGKLKPDIHVAKKLEQFLGISIINESSEPENIEYPVREFDLKDESLTIGDLIKMKDSKKE